MSDIQVTPGFATPFVVRHHPAPAPLNQALRELFIEREGDPRYAEKVPTLTLKVKLFESEFDLFKWSDPCVQELKHFCFDSLGKTLREVNGASSEDLNHLRIYNHAWFHVTRPGGYMGTHNHPMASWSGVYCVDPGGADAENPDSGVIRFHDPRASVTMYMDAGNNHFAAPYEPGLRNYRFQPGQLVLFPSFLMHEVAPFTGEGTRITVAFNAWIKDGRVDG